MKNYKFNIQYYIESEYLEEETSKIGEELSIKKYLSLYNVQFQIQTPTKSKLVNKFVYAFNREDAIRLITKKYENFISDTNNIYCQKVDIQHGMMFSI